MFMINGFDVVQVYNIPLPSARERRLVNIKGHIKKIIGRKGPYFDRMWSKHLFIAQKRDSITSEKKGKPGMHWQWQKNRYKQIPA